MVNGLGRQKKWAEAMAVTYFKRFRMEMDLTSWKSASDLPDGFFWRAWSENLIDLHAEIKFLSFSHEVDSQVFPILGDRWGCQRLMREIRLKPGFLPQATWLIGCDQGYCATIQGVVDRTGFGSIQNVAVLPGYRRRGLGKALVSKSLDGFASYGLRKAMLEVTAENPNAVRMYRDMGFTKSKTTYKAVTSDWV
ncbi:MAG: N-acetyltransferase [Planctomycetota bacterium]|nr:N-acetyltransferase [Planctomycetota bacterium]